MLFSLPEDHLLDIGNARLTHAGRPVGLPPKAFDLLAHLVQRAGALCAKHELLDALWPGRDVTEGVLKTAMNELRAGLGDSRRAEPWLRTVPKRGYCFVAEVQRVAAGAAEPGATAPRGRARPAGNIDTVAGPVGALVGRGPARSVVAELLGRHRLVTLCGPGGVGKTALAREVARDQAAPGGCWWIELAALPEGVGAESLDALLIRSMPQWLAGARHAADIEQALGSAPLMLVLDNAEHVLEALAPWLRRLLSAARAMQVLVTSREPLGLPGERIWRVPSLALPPATGTGPLSDAESLLQQRIAERGHELALDRAEVRAALATVCRALDGLPLALELAATRVPVMGLEALARGLVSDDDAPGRLRLLVGTGRARARRQRSLRAMLDWSHGLLPADERRLLRRLALFRGSFGLAAAEQLGRGSERPALDSLQGLVDKSLVLALPGSAEAPRFQLLQTVREYAAERLLHAGEQGEVEHALRRAVLDYWRQADAEVLHTPILAWVERHAPELDTLRVVVAQGLAALSAATPPAAGLLRELQELLGCTAQGWTRFGLGAEGARFLQALRPFIAAVPRDDTLQGQALQAHTDMAAASLCSSALAGLAVDEGLALAERASVAFQGLGDAPRAYYAAYLAWYLALETGDESDRRGHVARMQALHSSGWSVLLQRYALSARAYQARLQGDAATYLALCRQMRALCAAADARSEAWAAGHQLMLAEHDAGHLDAALASGREVMADLKAQGRLRAHPHFVAQFALLLAQEAGLPEAGAVLADGLPLLPAFGGCDGLLLAAAWMALRQGRPDEAVLLASWFDSPRRADGLRGASYGPRTLTRRSASALHAALQRERAAPELEPLRVQGLELGDPAAWALAGAPLGRLSRGGAP